MFRDDTGNLREIWLWLGAFLLIMWFFGCLASVVINAGTGFGEEHIRFGLKSGLTVFHCPPDVIGCLVGIPYPTSHWVVWMAREKQTSNGMNMYYRKLIDIPLWR